MDAGAEGRAQPAQRRHRWLGLLQAAGPECFHWQSAATGWLWLRAQTSGHELLGQGGLLVAGEVAGKVSCGHRICEIALQLVGPAGDARHLNPRGRNLYNLFMKTTLNINDQLLADAKALAAQQRTSLTRLIEEGLQLRLRAKLNSAKGGRLPLPVFEGLGGLVQGVDPLSNKALLEALGDDA